MTSITTGPLAAATGIQHVDQVSLNFVKPWLGTMDDQGQHSNVFQTQTSLKMDPTYSQHSKSKHSKDGSKHSKHSKPKHSNPNISNIPIPNIPIQTFQTFQTQHSNLNIPHSNPNIPKMDRNIPNPNIPKMDPFQTFRTRTFRRWIETFQTQTFQRWIPNIPNPNIPNMDPSFQTFEAQTFQSKHFKHPIPKHPQDGSKRYSICIEPVQTFQTLHGIQTFQAFAAFHKTVHGGWKTRFGIPGCHYIFGIWLHTCTWFPGSPVALHLPKHQGCSQSSPLELDGALLSWRAETPWF